MPDLISFLMQIAAVNPATTPSPPAAEAASADPAYEAGLAEIKDIDAELTAMQENANDIRRSSAVRLEQVRSLRLRFAGIALTDGASADEIYQGLLALRRAKAAVLRPIAKARLTDAHRRQCEALASLNASRQEIEKSDGYLKMTLGERTEWRTAFDAFAKQNAPTTPCIVQR